MLRNVTAGLALAVMLALPPAAVAAGRCGDHPWCDRSLSPDKRAGLLLRALTTQEKIGLLGGDSLTGVAGGAGSHTGAENGVPRVGLPPVYYSDGPVGPRQGKATPMPIPMALAATFDPQMAVRHGATIADEAKKKGNDVVFAPTVNIMRTPLAGRTFEGYGEDPFLVARIAVGWIKGAQGEGVIGDVKHFAANNQEGAAAPVSLPTGGLPLGFGGPEGQRMLVDSRVDQRTLREIYLPQFEAAVKEAGVGTIMCSYNRLNGQYACENSKLLQEILEREWGFKGYVLADYGAAHNTVASLNNGLDFEPWPPIAYQPALIQGALTASLASSDQLDEHIRRVLRTLFSFGFFDRDAYRDDDGQIDKAAHLKTAGEIEESAITLLKNDGGVLPLDAGKVRSIAIIGSDAAGFKTGGGSANVDPFSFTTPRDEIARRAGPGVTVGYDPGDDAGQAAAAARAADVAIVFASDSQTEGTDRRCLTLECGNSARGDQDGLISAVAAANPHTVVVLETGGPVLTPWRNAVPGIVEAWYPGADGGSAIARVLFGDADPGGRLPATFPAAEGDTPTSGDREKYPGVLETVRYKEGVLVGYRWYDAKHIEPAFPFGHGLSYTTFGLRGLALKAAPGGGMAAEVTTDVQNTGLRDGVAVPQLYLGLPQPEPGVVQPPRQLKGFQKLAIPAHGSRRATFGIDARALSYWDTDEGDWRVAPGCYDVWVGQSSRDLSDHTVLGVGDPAACPGAALRIPVPATASSARCKARTVSLALQVRRATVRRVTVYVGGKRRAVLRGARSRVRVRLPAGRAAKVRVRIVVQRTHGRRAVTRKRTLVRCPRR